MAACACSCSAAIFQPDSGYTPFNSFHHDHYDFSSLAPPLHYIPSAEPHFFDTFALEPEFWTEPVLSSADSDGNLTSTDLSAFAEGFDVDIPFTIPDFSASTFPSVSDSGSNEPHTLQSPIQSSSANSQTDHSNAPSVSQPPGTVSTFLPSPATSQGDEVLGCVDSSRVEKRKLNTLAARRCRQRRVDRMKSLEEELENVRRERDELKLEVSRLKGETEAMRGLLTRKGT
ncbi:hypothetical protein N7495_005442 [Penicillium taxi]|uniref:uncharacterized protein n=1 Tax=Penicillium taxi TaxID=168475 RepID=UPI0025450163|nr:uncharacterized protein N7495_005442 [Penicillium taxi]KAJ5893751.1 hypothetical protein N7495_005442 [Penicillium taxi]